MTKSSDGATKRPGTKSTRTTSSINTIKWRRVLSPQSKNLYQVSDSGRVRRLLTSTGEYRELKPWTSGGPYQCVTLYKCTSGNPKKKVYVHRLVAQAFVPGWKDGYQVHHKIGPGANRAKDLEWVTTQYNRAQVSK